MKRSVSRKSRAPAVMVHPGWCTCVICHPAEEALAVVADVAVAAAFVPAREEIEEEPVEDLPASPWDPDAEDEPREASFEIVETSPEIARKIRELESDRRTEIRRSLGKPLFPWADACTPRGREDVELGEVERELAAVEPADAPAVGLADDLTRDQRRSRRAREVRAVTLSAKRVSTAQRQDIEIGRYLFPETGEPRPRTRGECVDGERPCPFVACSHHLFLDVNRGAIKFNFPDLEVWEMNETCALDVADREGTTLEKVGDILNVTRERARQIEVKALAKVAQKLGEDSFRDVREAFGASEAGKRRLPILVERDEDQEPEGEESEAA